MKTIIENSVYLIIMTLICLLSIDFISMNMDVSKVDEIYQYIGDYIEIYGEEQLNHELDASTVSTIEKYVGDNNCIFSYEYETETNNYVYYRIKLTYSLQSKVFHINRSHDYKGMIRTQKEKTGE